MDEWRQRLFGEIVPAELRPTNGHSAATALEIAIGHARSEIAYVLELGRAHKLPTAGAVNGDSVWLVLGNARLEFAFDRKKGAILATVPGRDAVRITFDDGKGALVTDAGEFDARPFVRSAIDATVAAWKAAPPSSPRPRWDADPRAPRSSPSLEQPKKAEA